MAVVSNALWLKLSVWRCEICRLISSIYLEKIRSRDSKSKTWGMNLKLCVCVTTYGYIPEQTEKQRHWDPALTQIREPSTEGLVGGKHLSAGRTGFELEDSQSEPPASHYLLVACRAAHFCFRSMVGLITVSVAAGTGTMKVLSLTTAKKGTDRNFNENKLNNKISCIVKSGFSSHLCF